MARVMHKHKPSFFKIMHGDFHDQIRLPPGFAKNFNDPLPMKVLLQTSTRTQPRSVKLKKVEKKLVLTGEGWKGFVEQNSIEFGDLLVFRLLGDSKFYVKIYGTSGCEKERNMGECSLAKNKECSRKLVAKRYSCYIGDMRWRSKSEKERALEAASGIKSDYPCFLSRLCSSHTHRHKHNPYLHLPLKFVRNYLPKVSTDIWIVDSTGRRWLVKFRNVTKRAYMYQGWKTVVCENGLREGSLCVFELIDAKDIKLKLTVLNVVE